MHGLNGKCIPYPNSLMPRIEEILMLPIVLSTIRNLLKKLWPFKDSGQPPGKYFQVYNCQEFLLSLPKKMAEWKTLSRRGITRQNRRCWLIVVLSHSKVLWYYIGLRSGKRKLKIYLQSCSARPPGPIQLQRPRNLNPALKFMRTLTKSGTKIQESGVTS